LTGIGNYTTTQIETMIRTGRTPGHEQLFPVMPYMEFSGIAKDDMGNLIAYLLDQTPVSNTVPPRDLLFDPAPFTPTVVPSDTAPISGVARGEYIVEHLADCRGCHGPNLAGTPGFAPNITSDPDYGLGLLSVEQISNTLHTGVRPVISGSLRFNGDPIGSAMAGVIFGPMKHWTLDDIGAVAAYIATIPSVGNQPPAIGPLADVTTTVGSSFVYTAGVSDVDVFDALTVTALSKPAWLTLGPTITDTDRPVSAHALLTGTATISDVGAVSITLVVADSAGATATGTFTVTVSSVEAISETLAMPLINSQQPVTDSHPITP